jgi:hypothetical protein
MPKRVSTWYGAQDATALVLNIYIYIYNTDIYFLEIYIWKGDSTFISKIK